MKKSFSLMEIIIATVLLSVVMLSLFQIQGNSIFLLSKSQKSKQNIDYIALAMDTEKNSNRNKNIYFDKYFQIQNDDIRKEFKSIKLKIKDDYIRTDEVKFENITIKRIYNKTLYSFEKGMSKTIYRFEIEL